jgi:hypothetical protein
MSITLSFLSDQTKSQKFPLSKFLLIFHLTIGVTPACHSSIWDAHEALFIFTLYVFTVLCLDTEINVDAVATLVALALRLPPQLT